MQLLHVALKFSVVPYGSVFRERRAGLVILVYHRLEGGTRSQIDLPLRLFARQMGYLRTHYDVASLDALIDPSRPDMTHFTNDGHPDVAVVTFDDGTLDVYEHAFPILLQYRIPATIFVATRYIDEQVPFDFGGYPRQVPPARPLTWGQLREMTASGLVSVGAHTHTHPDLTHLPAAAVRDEVERGRKVIEDRLGVSAHHFAYPWGLVTPRVKQIVGEQFTTAVRGGCGKNPFATLDRLALWRQPIQRSDGMALFKLKLRSYLDGEEYVRSLAARVRGYSAQRSSA